MIFPRGVNNEQTKADPAEAASILAKGDAAVAEKRIIRTYLSLPGADRHASEF